MRLQRLKVERLRQFRQPFELAGIEPGLNLFVGPNEAGKSTLVRAIRAAFFERHRSSSVDDLLPWGDTTAAPSIELDFSIGTTAYRLQKTFLQRKRCELKAGQQSFDGEEAEQHLAALLGFRFAAKGGSKPEHWGIPGLLWIEQGSSQEIDPPVAHATEHLRKALEQSVSEVASSQGDALSLRVAVERKALLTPTGAPTAAYRDAIAERDALRERVCTLDERIGLYQEQVDQLSRLKAEQAADARERPWEALEARQAEAAQNLLASQALVRQLDADKASLGQIDTTLRLLEEQLAGFEEQQRALALRETALAEAEAAVDAARSIQEGRVAIEEAAALTCRQTAERLARSRDADRRAQLVRQAEESQARVNALTEQIRQAEVEQVQLSQYQTLAAGTVLDKKEIARLREQAAAINELRIRQEVASTRVRFELSTGARVVLDGQAIAGAGERLVTMAAAIEIADVGRFEIVPGGTDLSALAREHADLRSAHEDLLRRIGVVNLAEAESRHATHLQALKDIVQADKALASLAPKGIAALRSELDAQSVRRREAADRLGQMASEEAPPPVSSNAAVDSLAMAEAAHQAASGHLAIVSAQSAEARQACVAARTRREAALYERDTLNTLLEEAGRQQRIQATGQRLLAVRAERESLRLAIAAKQQAVDAAVPGLLAQDVERFKASVEVARRAFAERQTQTTLLQGKLEEAGAQGLEESRADHAVRAEAAERRHAELALRARALSLLASRLEEKRQDVTRRLRAPLQKHLDHYLQLLFPRASIDIDDDLRPGMLTRRGQAGEDSGAVALLSHGAREQMGVLTRLAYADMLKAAGRPTLIILDDALVHSDEQRLGAMKRVLFDAARRHQVLLFTCHPQAWRDMGAQPRAISRSVAAPA